MNNNEFVFGLRLVTNQNVSNGHQEKECKGNSDYRGIRRPQVKIVYRIVGRSLVQLQYGQN